MSNVTDVRKRDDYHYGDIIPIVEIKTTGHEKVIHFDSIYPLKEMVIITYSMGVELLSIEASIDGESFLKLKDNVHIKNELTIHLENVSARCVRLVFKRECDVNLQFHIGEGFIVKRDLEWEQAFLRYDGWSGADGIFSFNLTNGHDDIGASAKTTGFIFSDTFVGHVDRKTGLRDSLYLINNTLGYYTGNLNNLEFTYCMNAGQAESVLLPNQLIGFTENNLINGFGFDVYNRPEARLCQNASGVMWLSEKRNDVEIVFDLEKLTHLGNIYLWNFNEDPLKGVKDFELYYSNSHQDFHLINQYTLKKASGNEKEPYTQLIDLSGITTRYIKLKIISSYHSEQVGLGKVMFFDDQNNYLFAKVKASSTDKSILNNELTSRLWLQDGVVIGHYFYVFPITVKDANGSFMVTNVSLIKMPIKNEQFDFEDADYFDTPLESKTPDGGILYYGAGVLNLSDSGGVQNADGYVYIYGYKDINKTRNLIVARTLPENMTNFNSWEYYDGKSWSHNIHDSYGIKSGVSTELSVTYIHEGLLEGNYMLVVMEETVSGTVSYALSDTPYGPFSEYKVLYITPELKTMPNSTVYNAKMHPHLSEPGNYLISYNVNSSNLSTLKDVDYYRPRFIRAIEVRHR